MSSVKSRILQFQNQSPSEGAGVTPINNGSSEGVNGNKNNFHRIHNSTPTIMSSNNNHHQSNNGHEGTPPPKPPLNLTKTSSMNINLSTGNRNGTTTTPPSYQCQNKPATTAKTFLTRTSIPSRTTPKLVSPGHSNPTTPTGSSFTKTTTTPSTNGKLYGTSIDWKEKFEESEKKRTHVVTLAQKATRDFEELRRRYQDVYTENEKLVQKLDSSNIHLEKLRKASEATYDEYYKLKKKYQVENSAKSDALVRVDQYNKENRRLKRQSQVLMQQMNDSNFELEDIMEASAENVESDKEIVFLRERVQELEARVVDLESELEKTKLAEFETQESVLLMTDSVQSSKSETKKLLQQIRKLEDERADLKSTIEELTFELDSIKTEDSFQAEKLHAAENELLKVTTEKKVLQRQSMVFMSNQTDSQLLDALNQISELQFAVEEQKLNYEALILDLQDRLNTHNSEAETDKIEIESKIKAMENELEEMRQRAEDAEKNADNNCPAIVCPPPPPPPPPMMANFNCGPPPPPLPNGGSSLTNSLKTATLRKANAGNGNSESSSGTTSPSGSLTTSPQIDDVISQLKKGIKLRPMDRTLTRKQTEPLEKQGEETAVEEMRSILNNLKRTRRV